jgi:hypothetical protein
MAASRDRGAPVTAQLQRSAAKSKFHIFSEKWADFAVGLRM